jgi:hypothetical protein
MSSGNGPPAGHDPDDPRATGYRIKVSSERSPRCWPVTPTCAGSVIVICCSATPYVPAAPTETARAAEAAAEAVRLGVAVADRAGADRAEAEGAAAVSASATRGAEPPQAAVSTTAASATAASSLATISRRSADTTDAS